MSEPKEGWCDLYILQPAKNENDANAQEAHLPNVHVVSGVKEFVNVVRTTCGERKLRHLRIGSHGMKGSFRIGNDRITNATLGSFKSDLLKVKKYFAADFSFVTIDACNTGFERSIVTRLSTLWGGVPVKAFLTWQVSEPEGSVDNGPYRTCKKRKCVVAMETGMSEASDKTVVGKAIAQLAYLNYLLIDTLSDLKRQGCCSTPAK
jgi:hypothetical protein